MIFPNIDPAYAILRATHPATFVDPIHCETVGAGPGLPFAPGGSSILYPILMAFCGIWVGNYIRIIGICLTCIYSYETPTTILQESLAVAASLDIKSAKSKHLHILKLILNSRAVTTISWITPSTH